MPRPYSERLQVTREHLTLFGTEGVTTTLYDIYTVTCGISLTSQFNIDNEKVNVIYISYLQKKWYCAGSEKLCLLFTRKFGLRKLRVSCEWPLSLSVVHRILLSYRSGIFRISAPDPGLVQIFEICLSIKVAALNICVCCWYMSDFGNCTSSYYWVICLNPGPCWDCWDGSYLDLLYILRVECQRRWEKSWVLQLIVTTIYLFIGGCWHADIGSVTGTGTTYTHIYMYTNNWLHYQGYAKTVLKIFKIRFINSLFHFFSVLLAESGIFCILSLKFNQDDTKTWWGGFIHVSLPPVIVYSWCIQIQYSSSYY